MAFTVLTAAVNLESDANGDPSLHIKVDDHAGVNPDLDFLINLFRKAADELARTRPELEFAESHD